MQQQRPNLSRSALTRVGAGLGLSLTAASFGVVWGAGAYLQGQLLPQVEEALSQAMRRRVELGEVTFLAPWQVRLGESRIEHLATIGSIDISPDFWTWVHTGEWVLNLTLDQPQLLLMETLDRGWADIQFQLPQAEAERSLPIQGLNIQLRRGSLTAIPLVGERRQFEQLQAQAQIWLAGDRQTSLEQGQQQGQQKDSVLLPQTGGRASFQLSARLQAPGGGHPLHLRGVADFPQASGSVWVSSRSVPLDLLPSLLPQVPLTDVQGNAGLELEVTWRQDQPLELTGQAHLQQARLGLEMLLHSFEDLSGTVGFSLQGLQLEQVSGTFGQLRFTDLHGPIAFGADGFGLEASLAPASLAQVQETFGFELPVQVEAVLGGSLTVAGALTQPEIRGQLQGRAPGRVDRIPLPQYGLDFHFANQTLAFERINLAVLGGWVQGSGQLQLGSPQLQGLFQLQVAGVDAEQVVGLYGGSLPRTVGSVSGQVEVALTGSQPRIEAIWETTGGEVAGAGQLQIVPGARGLVVEVPQAVLTLDSGQATVSGQWAEGQVQAQVAPENLPLSFFNPQLTGSLSGDMAVQLNMAAMSELGFLRALRAQGTVAVSQGTAVAGEKAKGEITGQVAWDGSGLSVALGAALSTNQQAEPLDLATVQGRILVDPDTLQVGSLDLQLRVDEVRLAQIPGVPEPVQGVLRGEGQIQGSLEDWRVQGDVHLQGLTLGGIGFEALSGPFRWSRQGAEVDLQGQRDQLTLSLDPQFQPLQFRVRRGEAEAIGERQGERLQVGVQQLPLPLLASWIGEGPWASLEGILTGDLAINLRNRAVQGRASVADLRIAGIAAQGFSLDFDYRTDRITVHQAQLDLLGSTYTASGTLHLPEAPLLARLHPGREAPIPQMDLQISTTQGRLEDIISTFKWQRWSDLTNRGLRLPPLRPASVLETEPVGLPEHPLMEQLEYYAQVLATHLETLASRMDPLIPPPSSLRGEFQASVKLVGELSQPSVSFQLDGQNWQAEEFAIETLTASGSFADGAVVLQPLLLRSGERQARFSGSLGLNEQSGSLQIQGLPLALVDRFLPDGLELEGDLNLDVELTGNLRDPNATGSLTVFNAQINQVPLREVGGQFAYNRGQLRFNSTFLVNGDEPIRMVGLVPYTLPFAHVQAESDQIDLTLQAQNGGLRLINLFTDQVRWEEGQSQLDLTIQGTLQEPRLRGSLSVSDGILSFAALPEPITNLNGQIAFNLNQLEVQQLSGQFGQGSLLADGILPINSRGALQLGEGFQPLSLQLQGINLALPNLYSGHLEGEVVVTGLLLQPLIEGHLQVSEGIVDVSPRNGSTAAVPGIPSTPLAWQPRLNGLELTLGSGIQILRRNLFEFNASGKLRLLGTLQDLRPAGTITLDRGRVTLPIAAFRLDRSRPNTATFDLDNGLDPFLDLRLVTQATEVYRFPQDISPFNNNRNVLGSQQSIDIFATVNGRASELGQADPRTGILALSSSPSRSPEEIVALLGGTALARLNAEVGVAGLAGSALLNDFQEALGDVLGLDEIRLSPVPQIDTRAPNRSSVGLALEVAKDLGPTVSVSVQRNLTDPFQPTRYSARYRINEQTLARASTDLEGNNVISVEFGTRF
ncbi:MAG: translocation/assembly module TamB domain-containing protein [Cyanobacteriota bacterium]